MGTFSTVMNWIMDNRVVILAFLFTLSEALALIPAVKANSVFQLIFSFLEKEKPPAALK